MKWSGGGHHIFKLTKKIEFWVDWGWDFTWLWVGFESIFWLKEQFSLDVKLGVVRAGFVILWNQGEE